MSGTGVALLAAVDKLRPLDDLEGEHVVAVRAWVVSGAPLCRTAKPATPAQHLVSYFVLHDRAEGKILLVDHVKAGLWLPAGGHVEPGEDPRDTVVRECREELAVDADFSTACGVRPLFVTVTATVGPAVHTDVSLWYVLAGDSATVPWFDPVEMRGVRWWSLPEIRQAPGSLFDPHLRRFIRKLEAQPGGGP